MKPVLLLALLVVVAGLAGAAYFLGLDSAPPGDGSSLGSAPTEAADGPRGAATLAAAAPRNDTPSSVAAGEREQVGAAEAPVGPTRPLRVEVITEGPLAAEDARVVALSRAEMGRTGAATLLQRVRDGEMRAAGQAPLDARGFAELEVPESAGDVALLIDGRYLFVADAVDVPAGAEELQLEAKVGAHLEVRLLPPAGEAPSGSVSLMGGNFSEGGGGWQRRERDLGSSTALEFRGVDPGLTWMLQPTLDAHHADMRMGLELTAGETLALDVEVMRGATVRGEVVDETGAPMADVEVATASAMPWMGGSDSRSARTDAEGRFVLAGLPPGTVEIEAEREGWLDASTGELELADGETRSGVRLVLDSGFSIDGVVLLPGGDPVRGARVRVERLVSGGWGGPRLTRMGSATSGSDGRFSVTGLGEGNYTVRASLEREESGGWLRAVAEAVRAGGPELTLALEAPVGFDGRVVDDLGQPVTAFTIDVSSVDDGGPRESQDYESEDGTFRFERAGPGTYELRAEADGHVQLIELEVVLPGAGDALVVELARTARVSGTVVLPGGAPRSEATVRGGDGSSQGGFGGWGGPRGPRTTSDGEGAFALEDVEPGTFELTASAEGYADSEAATIELAPGEVRDDLVLALRTGGRIEGTVYSPEGEALADQRVTWGDNAMGFGSNGETRTDAAGFFSFDAVTPGEWAVSAVPSFDELGSQMRSGGQNAFVEVMGQLVTKTVTVEDGETVTVELGGEPRRPVRVFGTVTRAGEPLEGAEVYAVSESSAVFQGMKTTRAAADGSFEIVLDRPGPHTISATSGDVGVEVVVEVPREDELRVDLAIPRGRIEGRVLESDGSPASGISVTLQRDDGLGRIRWAGGQKTTDETGAYAFDDLQAGTYTVRANLSGWGGRTDDRFGTLVRGGIDVAEDQTTTGVDFELEDPGRVAGTVVGEDGKPVAGVSIYFRDEAGRLVSRMSGVTSDAAGRFESTSLTPGTYAVSARADTLAAGDDVTVTVVAGETAEARVVVAGGTMVTVRLESADGEVRRARVQMFDESGHDVAGLITLEAMQSIFNEGSSTLEETVGPIPPGRYTVRATASDGRIEERSVRVRANDPEMRVVLKLDD